MEALFSYFIVPLLIVIFVSLGALKIAGIFLDVWLIIANNLFRDFQSLRDIGRKSRLRRQNEQEEEKQKEKD